MSRTSSLSPSARVFAAAVVFTLVVSLSPAAVPDASLVWLMRPAEAKFKSETKDKNTLDPAVNNYLEALAKVKKLDFDGAIDSCLQAIYFARNNYHPEAYILLGNCYKIKKEDAKAIDALGKGIVQKVGVAPDAHCDLAEIFMRNNRDREAQAELNRALAEFKGPGPRAHFLMGRLLEKKADHKNAQWHYLQALGDQPWWYTEAWMCMAECSMHQKAWSEAIGYYTQMLLRGKTLIGVDYQRLWLNMGACQFAKGDHHGAMDSWQNCLQINPNNAGAHLMLGLMFDKESHLSSAIKEYRQYLRSMPESDKSAPMVRDRLLALEQLVKPAEADPSYAKPTPMMRKEVEDQVAEQRQQEELQRQAMENLEAPGGSAGPRPDSGF